MKKQCIKCKQIYEPADEYFSKNNKRKDGLQAYCKVCNYDMQKISRANKPMRNQIIKPKIEGFKVCSKCNETKPLDSEHYNISKSQPDGFHSYCKECQKKYWDEYKLANKEKILSRRKERYYENPSIEIQKVREYQINNPEIIKVIKKRHAIKQAEHIQERVRKWKLNNPEHAKLLKHINRVENIDLSVDGFIELYKKFELLNDKYFCNYCKCELTTQEVTIDHVIPLSKGGQNALSNLVISCFKCNVRKGTKLI